MFVLGVIFQLCRKLQNPVANPGFAFKMLTGRFLGRLGLKSSGNVKLQHDDGGVHPSLEVPTNLKSSAESLAILFFLFPYSSISLLPSYLVSSVVTLVYPTNAERNLCLLPYITMVLNCVLVTL